MSLTHVHTRTRTTNRRLPEHHRDAVHMQVAHCAHAAAQRTRPLMTRPDAAHDCHNNSACGNCMSMCVRVRAVTGVATVSHVSTGNEMFTVMASVVNPPESKGAAQP